MQSRERMLQAIDGGDPDYVPLSFMIFRALRGRTAGWERYLERSIDLGLDPVVDLNLAMLSNADQGDAAGPPTHLGPEVSVREWREWPAGRACPLLHKHYTTPAGTLTCAVNQTDDWPYGDHVPLLNDYVEPRAEKFPVTGPDDLDALKYLLTVPTGDDLRACRAAWEVPKQFAAKHGLMVSGGWGIGADATAWLFGLTNAVLATADQPQFLDELLAVIGQWNRRRMEIVLNEGVDLFIRRGWYEGTSFWSPSLYRRFLLPRLKDEVRLAHEAGARFGYIMTVGALQMLDSILEAGVDVIIGVEDVQDHGMDLAAMKAQSRGKVTLWGGVNGFVTIERGTDEQIRAATVGALDTLGPDRFILSPVDNIRDTSDEVWRNVLVFIDAWKAHTRGT